MIEGIPLRNIEAEQALIGAVLCDTSKKLVHAKAMIQLVKPSHFWRSGHRAIWAAITSLVSEDIRPDLLILQTKLGSGLQDAGGEDYLIACLEMVPSAANYRHYAAIVIEASTRREVIQKAKRLITKAEDETESPDSILADCRILADGVTSPKSPIVKIDQIAVGDDGDKGVPSGYREFDSHIGTAGYPSGQVTIVSAYHKAGKTTFMTGSALSILDNGGRVLFATFADLTPKQLKRRMLRQICGWSKRPIDLVKAAEFDDAVKIINCHDLDIYDGANDDTGTIESFAGHAELAHTEKPYTAIFLDYIQVMTTAQKLYSEVHELTMISKQINRLARRLEVPIIVGSQVTEGTGGNRTKTKGATSIEADAGCVLRLKRDDGATQLEIAFSRFGGGGSVMPLTFDRYKERLT